MTLHVPVWLQSASGDPDIQYSAAELRNWAEALIRRGSGFPNERGVLSSSPPAFGFKVSQRAAGGPGFAVDVANGRAIITDTDVTAGGAAIVWNDATYTLATPPPPASGTDHHRVILQLRNKLENGVYTTYDFVPFLVPAVGGVLQAEPNSAITLASVAIANGQASVLNANITDLREAAGPVSAYKAADSPPRSNTTTMANDPDLQLLNLAANAIYKFEGSIVYTAGTGTDMKFTFATTSATGLYCCPHINTSGNFGPFGQALGDITHCQGQTVTQPAGAPIEGTIDTGNAPCSVILQWAQDTSGGAFTIIKAGSFLRAERIQ